MSYLRGPYLDKEYRKLDNRLYYLLFIDESFHVSENRYQDKTADYLGQQLADNLMSSSLLNKRIILHIEAKKCSNDVEQEQKDEEEVNDNSPPVKKTFLGMDGNDNGASTTDISTIQIGQDSSSGPIDPGSNSGLKQRTKLWMKPGGSSRSPRVGSDFQATIE